MTKLFDRSVPVYAVIPAAGSGSRMNLPQNKQFLQLGRYPMIVRTLRVFEAHPSITGYLVVTAADELNEMRNLVESFALTKCLGFATGGESRQESVASGLDDLARRVADLESTIVLVHDGARCFVTADIIDRVIAGVRLHLACGAAVPVKDTIKRANSDGLVLETLNRGQLFALQTPQGASYKLMRAAYTRALAEGWHTTDDLSVLEQSGMLVHLVSGDNRNIKITTPEDRLLAEQMAETEDLEGR